MIILKREFLIPFFLLTFPIFIDALNGYHILYNDESSSLATIYKLFVLLYTSKSIFSSKIQNVTKGIIVVLLICYVYQFFFHGAAPLSEWIKFIYPYFVVGYFLQPNNKFNTYTILRCIVWYGAVASIIIIICGVTGFGYNPYGSIIGTRGLFKGGNEICLTMLLTNCLTIYMYQKYAKIIDFLIFILISSACVIMATTSGIAGTIIVFLGFVATVFFLKLKNYKSSKIQKLLLLFIGILASFYVIDILVNSLLEIDFLSRKFENINERFTESSGRSHLILAAEMAFMNFSALDWLFGASNYYHAFIGRFVFGDKTLASAEVDWLDPIGDFGIVGAATLMYIPIKAVFISIKHFITTRKLESFWLLWINFLFVFTAFYAGHALVAMNAMVLLLIVNYLFLKN